MSTNCCFHEVKVYCCFKSGSVSSSHTADIYLTLENKVFFILLTVFQGFLDLLCYIRGLRGELVRSTEAKQQPTTRNPRAIGAGVQDIQLKLKNRVPLSRDGG